MEPFSIQCESCHARLKVTKASLIGKRLPCPKCQSPIRVPANAPAADDQEGPASPQEDTPSAPKESLGGFDDVDDLLSQLPATAKQRSKPRQRPPRDTGAVKTPAPDATADPINSDTPWDNPAAAKTRRILALAAATAGVILLAAIGSYAWLNHSPAITPIDDIALAESAPIEPPPSGRATAQTTPSSQTEENNDKLPPTQPVTNEVNPAEISSGEPEELTSEQPIVSSTPPPLDTIAPALNVNPGSGLNITSPVTSQQPKNDAPQTGSDSVPSGTRPANNGTLRPVTQASSALSELSSLLEESGSSISAITDATATAAAIDAIGLPKYHFQASRLASIDAERQLSQPCTELRYHDVSMIEILRDITVISGVPISIDPASLISRGGTSDKRLIPNISVQITETDFREAIEQVAQQAGWTSNVNETGVWLSEPNAASPLQKTIDLTPIAELEDHGLDGVVDSIKVMIAAETWFSDTKQFQIDRNGMSLTVQHEPAVVRQVERFINKISAAIQLTKPNAAKPNAANKDSLKKLLKTRLGRARSNLAASCELEIGSRATLDDLLNRIRKKSGVDVIVNWQTLAALAWTPRMTAPGNISEPTLDKMLRQLERSTASAGVVLDANTIELTHPVDAANRSYVEFYLIPDLLERNFTPQHAIQLTQEAIQNAGQPAGLTLYEPRCQCIILAAPQSTHRVMEAALLKVRQPN